MLLDEMDKEKRHKKEEIKNSPKKKSKLKIL